MLNVCRFDSGLVLDSCIYLDRCRTSRVTEHWYWQSRGQIVYRRNRMNGARLLQRTLNVPRKFWVQLLTPRYFPPIPGAQLIWILVFMLAMVGLYISPLFINSPCVLLISELPPKPKIMAHRGASGVRKLLFKIIDII